jgi:hypothetical protein
MNMAFAGLMNNRLSLLFRSLCLAALAVAGLGIALADPILPYATPLSDQLTNDIAVLEATPDRTPDQNQQLRVLRTSLMAYQRSSTSVVGDVAILRDLSGVLPDDYTALLNDALTGYTTDFWTRHHEFEQILATSARSSARRQATTQLGSISNTLAKIVEPISPLPTLGYLNTAARRLIAVSNVVYRARVAPIKPSSMTAKISKLSFQASRQSTVGFLTNGLLNVAGFHVADLGRAIQLHVTGVTTNTPATYPLAGDSFATYTAMAPSGRVFIFQSIPESGTNVSTVTIEGITERFVIGKFSFTGVLQAPVSGADTNSITTITNGEFQLNFY